MAETQTRWYSGTGAPLQSDGALGDWFLNYSNGSVYEKTATAVWTYRMNLTGAQGPIGPTGPTGPTGPVGATGLNSYATRLFLQQSYR